MENIDYGILRDVSVILGFIIGFIAIIIATKFNSGSFVVVVVVSFLFLTMACLESLGMWFDSKYNEERDQTNEAVEKVPEREEKYRLTLGEEEYVFNATCNMYGIGNSLRIEYVVSDSEWFVVTNGTLTWYDNGAVSCYADGWSIVKQE